MKKLILFIVGAVLLACASHAQIVIGTVSRVPTALTTTSFGNLLDTVVNTAVKVTTPAKVKAWKNGVTILVVVTKISGTVGGTLALQGSMTGLTTDWITIGSPPTVTDATNNYAFNTVVSYYYYRISWTGTGTMSASFKSHLQLY